jgi:hypothetical protein
MRREVTEALLCVVCRAVVDHYYFAGCDRLGVGGRDCLFDKAPVVDGDNYADGGTGLLL